MKIFAYSKLALLKRATEELWTRKSEETLAEENYFEGDFPALLEDFYRLEYAYSMLKNKPFSGNEKRKENILRNVENTFREVCNEVRIVLVHVYEEWLKHHAITEPSRWAYDRVMSSIESEDDIDYAYDNIIGEYMRYAYEEEYRKINYPPTKYQILKRKAEQDIFKDSELISVLKDVINWDTYVEDMLNDALMEFDSDPEEVRERYQIPENIVERDDVKEFLKEIFQEEEDISIYIEDIGEALKNADPDEAERFLLLFAEKLVFPAWYSKWSTEGIDETRDNIEEIYSKIQHFNPDLGKMYGDVNLALNAAHQTGGMVEYVNQYTNDDVTDLLQRLTDGYFVEEVNKYLREAGVKI